MNIGRPLRIAGATTLLIGGLIHLQLYFKGYRAIHSIGRSFLLNAIASGVIAALLLCRKEWFVKVAGIGVAAGTIGAFIISRRGAGLFDFREHGLQPSPQAILSLLVESVTILVLVLALLPALAARDRSSPRRALAFGTATAAILLVGFGAYWARHYHTTINTAANDVKIAEFAFAPPKLSVSKGTTVAWTNADTVEHSIVADDKSFRSDSLAQGISFRFRFAADGTFSYHCGIHPSMAGTITVTG